MHSVSVVSDSRTQIRQTDIRLKNRSIPFSYQAKESLLCEMIPWTCTNCSSRPRVQQSQKKEHNYMGKEKSLSCADCRFLQCWREAVELQIRSRGFCSRIGTRFRSQAHSGTQAHHPPPGGTPSLFHQAFRRLVNAQSNPHSHCVLYERHFQLKCQLGRG